MKIFLKIKEAVYFSDHLELTDLINFYAKNFKKRSEIALNGKTKYFKLFENHIVTKYMIEKIMNIHISNRQIWMN